MNVSKQWWTSVPGLVIIFKGFILTLTYSISQERLFGSTHSNQADLIITSPSGVQCYRNKPQSIHLHSPIQSYLRLRERSLTGGEECAPSSSATLSVLRKCLNRKWRSSWVGWKGNWCNNSWEEEDWEGKAQRGWRETGRVEERKMGKNSVQRNIF